MDLCSWTSFSLSLSLSLSITLSLSLSLHVFIYLYTHICQCYSCTTFSLFFSLCSGFVYSDFLFCFVFCFFFLLSLSLLFLLYFLFSFLFVFCFFFLLSLSLFLFTLFSFLLLFRYLGGGREKFLFIYENWVSLMQPLLSLTQTNSDWLFLENGRSILIFSKLFLKKHKLK